MICHLELIVENHTQVRHRYWEQYRVQQQFDIIDADLWQLLALRSKSAGFCRCSFWVCLTASNRRSPRCTPRTDELRPMIRRLVHWDAPAYHQRMSVLPVLFCWWLRTARQCTAGKDYIPTSHLKSCADTFSLLISHLANLSFSQATFPTSFKFALISPLLKKPASSTSDPSNFRPISNLYTIGKIFGTTCSCTTFPPCVGLGLSQFPSFSVYLPQIPLNWNCSAQTYKRHLGKLWQNYYSHCSRHVCSIWYSWPRHAPSQAFTYIWLLQFSSRWHICFKPGSPQGW